MESEHQQKEAALLEAALQDAVSGKTGYEALMDALGRATAEQVELLAVRSPHEKRQPDGSPVVELLKACAPGSSTAFWLVLTGKQHLQALSGGRGPIPTAVLTLGTLLSMAEDAAIGGLVFNPDTRPNLTIRAAELPELKRRAEDYLEKCRQEKLRSAAAMHRPGWIL